MNDENSEERRHEETREWEAAEASPADTARLAHWLLCAALAGCANGPDCPAGTRRLGSRCAPDGLEDAAAPVASDLPDTGEDDEGAETPPDEDTDLDASGASEGGPTDAVSPDSEDGADAATPPDVGSIDAATGDSAATTDAPPSNVDIDECAQPNACTNPAYPCVQTAPPGYTCQGQFADWPMPDAVSSSKTKPVYDWSAVPGVVIDKVTGLIWEREVPVSYPAYCTGNQGTASDTCTWDEAKAYCAWLNLGGSSDWRLPTKIELESIVDDSRQSYPAINETAFPGVQTTTARGGSFWAVSAPVGDSVRAWVVGVNGGTSLGAKSTPLRVRCVRSEAKLSSGSPESRYDVHGSTVTDTRTGLEWERLVAAGTYTVAGAKEYCSTLSSSWRVPTKKELLTLIDPRQALGRALIDPVFQGTLPLGFWAVNRLVGAASGTSWDVSFANGNPEALADTELLRVRCVR